MSESSSVIRMPEDVPAAQREAWILAGTLREIVPDGWTVVGGQMVQFHGWRTGTTPVRTTTDLDAAIAARAHPRGFHLLSAALQDLGLSPVNHPSGVEHRWQKQGAQSGVVQVDLLLPSGLGDRAGRSVNGSPGFESRGVQWATDMSRLWRLAVDDQRLVVPVPTLLGSVLAKASAVRNAGDRDRDRHLSDIRFLAGLATRQELGAPLTPRQATRVLNALDLMRSPGNDVAALRMAMERTLLGSQ